MEMKLSALFQVELDERVWLQQLWVMLYPHI